MLAANVILQSGEPGLLGETADSRTQEIYKMNLGHLLMLESKDMLNNNKTKLTILEVS